MIQENNKVITREQFLDMLYTFDDEVFDRVVDVHIRSFPGFFLTFLGPSFLEEFYGSFLVDDEGVGFVALDEENLTNWATGVYTNEYLKECAPEVSADQAQAAGDFVSSQVVVEAITEGFDDSDLSEFLGGQNSYGGFAAAAPLVNAKLMTGSDDAIQRALGDPVAQYLNGEIEEEEMWNLWKDNLAIEFPDLMVP